MHLYVLLLLLSCFYENILAKKPEIDPLKAVNELEQHESLQLMCSIRKGSKPITFEWFKNGSRIEVEDGTPNISMNPSSSILSFDNILSQHSGNYSCKAYNLNGSDQSSTIVRVKGLFLSFLTVMWRLGFQFSNRF